MKKFMFCVLISLVFASCSYSDEPQIMKIASITSTKPDSYEYICESMFSKLISEYTNGTVKSEYYPASQLGSSLELAEAVAIGTVQSTVGLGYDLYANLEPLCMIVCMPYLFRDYEHFRAFLGNSNLLSQKLAADSNILVLGHIYRSARVTITNGKGIKTPDDFKGMVIRSPESTVNVKWLETMGASPVTITWGELFTSLSQGAAQGAENSITTIADSSLQDIVKFCSETNHMMVVNVITVNKTWFDSLSSEQQAAIRRAAKEVTEYSWEAFREPINAAWEAFEKAGATCIRANEIDFDAFQRKSADVYKYFVQEGYFTEDQYNRILNMKY